MREIVTVKSIAGEFAIERRALYALCEATTGPDCTRGLHAILWDSQNLGGQLVATNGHYLLSVDIEATPPQGPITFNPTEIRAALATDSDTINVETYGTINFPNWRLLPIIDVVHPFELGKLWRATTQPKQPAIFRFGALKYPKGSGTNMSIDIEYGGDRCSVDTAYLAEIMAYLITAQVHIAKIYDPVLLRTDGAFALIMPLRQ